MQYTIPIKMSLFYTANMHIFPYPAFTWREAFADILIITYACVLGSV